jgi:carbon storage regulator
MLVFTRRKHEAIMIGDGVEVRILRVGKEGVRLGIVAPPEVRVHRREIYEQIRDANQSAVVSPGLFTQLAERLTKAK